MRLLFPDGFVFPFGDESYGEAFAYAPGYLSFSSEGAPAATDNRPLPTAAHDHFVSLAPFWGSMRWDSRRYPRGNLHTALLEEEGARIFVIEWRDIGHALGPSASFNFQVVLSEDGSFDFRYGDLDPRDSDIPSEVLAGSAATIGWQLPDRTGYGLISYNGTPSINGSPARRSFSYRRLSQLPLSGELRFSPLGRSPRAPLTITASRDGREHARTVALEISHHPLIDLDATELPPTLAGEDFILGWTSAHALGVEIVDETGTVRCTAPSQRQIDRGACALREEAPGSYRYRVRAIGAHGSSAEGEASVEVLGDFGVASFQADAELIEKGEDVLLSWLTVGAISVRLFGGETELFHDPTGAARGSFLLRALESPTLFRLEVLGEGGTQAEAWLAVDLLGTTLDLVPSATRVRPGEAVTIQVDASITAQRAHHRGGVRPGQSLALSRARPAW